MMRGCERRALSPSRRRTAGAASGLEGAAALAHARERSQQPRRSHIRKAYDLFGERRDGVMKVALTP
jgi:hypothetical protein